MAPRNIFNFWQVPLFDGTDWTPEVDKDFDEFDLTGGLASFEDRVQVEARHLREDWQ